MENLVVLTPAQYSMGSLILMVSYGAHFAFVLYFLAASTQLAPRFRLVAWLSAVVMVSAGLSLLKEAQAWADTFGLVDGLYVPLTEERTFTNVYRYGNWTITVPLLLMQLPLAFALPQAETRARAGRMIVAGVLMIWTGLAGQFHETGNLLLFNLWGIVSTLFFVWLLIEIRGTLTSGTAAGPASLTAWPRRLWWYMLAAWGLYPIAYALPQLGDTATVAIFRQGMFSVADISSKLIYGVILSRYCLRRSALLGFTPAIEALGERIVGPRSAPGSLAGDTASSPHAAA